MDEKRPMRRKDKDNPYSIFTNEGKYFVMFKDSTGNMVTTEISEEVYSLFDRFELEDLAHMKMNFQKCFFKIGLYFYLSTVHFFFQ